ncbi:MAG: macrolide ABC transporter permease, partial [Phycisphaerales bacterium]
MSFLLETLRLGLTNLLLHKLRSILTSLGIILGVAAVIIMVSIGEGNK